MVPPTVRNVTSTMAAAADGLYRLRSRRPVAVDPPAKSHWEATWVAHGAVLQPWGPLTIAVPVTPPCPNENLVAEAVPAGPAGGVTTELPRAGTRTPVVAGVAPEVYTVEAVSYTHLRAHETGLDLVGRLL